MRKYIDSTYRLHVHTLYIMLKCEVRGLEDGEMVQEEEQDSFGLQLVSLVILSCESVIGEIDRDLSISHSKSSNALYQLLLDYCLTW